MLSLLLPLTAANFAVQSLASAIPDWQSWSGPSNLPPKGAQALYVMTNDVSGNEVVAMSLGADGSVSGGSKVGTGGSGGNYLSPVDGSPHFPDALSAQDAVVQAGNVSQSSNPQW